MMGHPWSKKYKCSLREVIAELCCQERAILIEEDIACFCLIFTLFCLIWGWNNNKDGGYSNRLAKFPLQILPITTINFFGFSVGDNHWELRSVFCLEGGIKASGEFHVR